MGSHFANMKFSFNHVTIYPWTLKICQTAYSPLPPRIQRRGGIYIFKLYGKIHLQNIFTTTNLTLTMFCGIPDFLSLLGCVHTPM